MYRHLYEKTKSVCPGTHHVIELTPEIKQYVMDNRTYHVPPPPPPVQVQPNKARKPINNGRSFEEYAMEYHRITYGHEVWHNTTIPLAELYACGIINENNQVRMEKRVEKGLKTNTRIYLDYGLDFLAKETCPDGRIIYHACQAKNYNTKKISAKDIGTFMAVLMGQVQAEGYLYTTYDLEPTLKASIANAKGIRMIHVLLDMNIPLSSPHNELLAEIEARIDEYTTRYTENQTPGDGAANNALDIYANVIRRLEQVLENIKASPPR
jgi:hypothetical protein